MTSDRRKRGGMECVEQQNENNRLRKQLKEALVERDSIQDERDEIKERFEEEMRNQKDILQDSIHRTTAEVKEKYQKRVQVLQTQLDYMNRAVAGDPCGWREAHSDCDMEDTKKVRYINDETREVAIQIPKVLKLAIAILRAGKVEEYEHKYKMALKKAANAETAKLKLQL